MENEIGLVSRKERKRLADKQRRTIQVRRGAALLGTTLTACSLVTPLAPATIEAEATTVTTRAATNTSAFIAEIASHAQPVADANDLYASVMIAQAVIESGWGTSALAKAPNHNLFGIKGSYQGNSITMSTQEYLNGQWVTMNEPFRAYPSYQQSFEDNAYVLRNVYMGGQYYYRGAWKSNCSSYQDATAWLTGRYATAPHYAAALNNVIATYNLTQYDTPASGNAGGGATVGNSGGSTSTGSGSVNTSGATYTVQSGDSVWLIANKYGITMNQLIQWNNIQNNFIYPGQKLIVSQSGSTNSSTSNTGSSSNTGATGNTANNTTNNPSTGANQYYTVQSGDSVWLIANKYGISMNQLIQWNNIQNNFIYPGQKLIVSQSGSTNSSTSNTGSSSNTGATGNTANNTTNNPSTGAKQYYTVKSGDSVWLVANNNGITMNQLIQWNNIQNNFIYPGQKLIVGQGGTSNTGSSSSSTVADTNTNTNTSTAGQYYTVKSGDSVWLVAHNNNITMNQLIQWNGIKNNFIYPGQKLIVNKTTGNTNSNQSSNTSTTTTGGGTYTTVSGDSLWGISQKYGLSISQLKQLNNLTSDTIYIGQTLKVK